jgi:hypothetical protein
MISILSYIQYDINQLYFLKSILLNRQLNSKLKLHAFVYLSANAFREEKDHFILLFKIDLFYSCYVK